MTDETVFAWLVERGQPEGQVPTVWWTGSGWTEDANKADRFSREAAEAVIEAKFTPPASRGGPSARAVEHGFVPSMTDETPAPLTAEEPVCIRLARKLLDPGTPQTRHERERLALLHLPDILAIEAQAGDARVLAVLDRLAAAVNRMANEWGDTTSVPGLSAAYAMERTREALRALIAKEREATHD